MQNRFWLLAPLTCAIAVILIWRAGAAESLGGGLTGIPANQESAIQTVSSFEQANAWLAARMPQMVKDCRSTMADGTAAYPPQIGGGYHAFWLRDYAYLLEGAADLIPREELIAAAKLFVDAISEEGAGSDCVKFDGTPIYKPGYGSMGENPVADGSQFTVAVVYLTWKQTGEPALLQPAFLDRLVQTMDVVVRDAEHGLVLIDPFKEWDRCSYGFTDTVRKKGLCFFESLLYVEASRRLSEMLYASGRQGEAERFAKEARRVSDAINSVFWDKEAKLYRAATVQCKEHDIWGSAFAVWLGVADQSRARQVGEAFKANHAGLTQKGGLRHTLPGVYWEKACKPDTYQNGGFWGTPLGWYAYTLNRVHPELADQVLIDLVNDYANRGVSEWVFDDMVALPNGYMASAALPLLGMQRIKSERK
jgi:hypothetical protein